LFAGPSKQATPQAVMVEIGVSKNDIIKILSGKIISNTFSFRGHRTLKSRLKFILKNLFFVQFKTKWSKIKV